MKQQRVNKTTPEAVDELANKATRDGVLEFAKITFGGYLKKV